MLIILSLLKIHTMRIRYSLILTLCVSLTAFSQQFDPTKIEKHISILASDSLEGRGTGQKGEQMAAAYITSEFKKLKLKPMGDSKTYLQAFTYKGGTHGEGPGGTANNIVAFLDNKAKTTIIIGAHYDHLGVGEQGSSLDANPAGKIHNGADDNASGVAGVIELANYFTNNKKKEADNFLFITFSGEELGLFGSKYFTEHPTIDLATVNYMINMDMVGRLNPDTKALMIHGTGTSPVWEPLIKKLDDGKFKISTDSSGVGPSDHTSFYLKDLPVLHFFTGSHSDYHKPSDDTDKINAQGEADVLTLIAKIIDAPETQSKLGFLKTKSKDMGTRSAFKVTLGIMPAYTSDVAGLKVDGVTEGRAGEKAGMQTGDIVIQMGEYKINDIQDYMKALGNFEGGQTIDVVVKRGEEEVTLKVTF